MITPVFPLIAIGEDSVVELIPSDNYFAKVATSALLDKTLFQQTHLFDKSGNIWMYEQVCDKFKNNFLTRLLAKTFYNPLLDAKVIWTKSSTYQLKELQEKLKHCVDKDDDIITQYEESDVIKTAIDRSATFDDIVVVLNKYVFAVNEQALWKEQEIRPK